MIYLDMDGVLSDFDGAARSLFDAPPLSNRDYDMAKTLGITSREFWDTISNEGESFWANMPKEKHFDELMGLVGSTPFLILTAPSLNPHCLSGKVKWLQKHFGPRFYSYIMAPARYKYLVCKPGDILIDDKEETIEKWREVGGYGILYPQPWNSNRDIEVIPYLRSQLYGRCNT